MAIYETERKAMLFEAAVDVDPATIKIRQQGVEVRVVVRSGELFNLEKDLAAGSIDTSRLSYVDRQADELAAILERNGDVVTVNVDGPQALYDPMWDFLDRLESMAKRTDKRVGCSEISHGAVPDNGCALVRVFSFPH
ncbi:MAG: hypothetical protein AAB800_04345 [Patescibacteria group bacterium]